jgi:hypothetical protein
MNLLSSGCTSNSKNALVKMVAAKPSPARCVTSVRTGRATGGDCKDSKVLDTALAPGNMVGGGKRSAGKKLGPARRNDQAQSDPAAEQGNFHAG